MLLCDAGPPRNAAAVHVHTFVTRDGTPPKEFRRIGREQLAPYTSVETREARVEAIRGNKGAFVVQLETESVSARRVLLCTGMIDEVPELEGFRALWGSAIFQCPYCHGWEVQDQKFGYLAQSAEMLEFALLLRGWSRDVVVLTQGRFAVPSEVRARVESARVRFEERPVVRLVAEGARLKSVELEGGGSLPLDVIFTHPHQRQVDLVRSLGLELDEHGFVRVHEMSRETSVPGIYAGGDLVTRAQAAILAAASGNFAAAQLNHGLTAELATSGALA